MARRRWRMARLPRDEAAEESVPTLVGRAAVSAMGGRLGSVEGAVRERGREPRLEIEPRGWEASKLGGAMKSSAITPGAIWRLPRREVGLLRLERTCMPSSFARAGVEEPPNGECQAGKESLLAPLCGRDLFDSVGDAHTAVE